MVDEHGRAVPALDDKAGSAVKKLLILQPYIPEYRVAFFRDLRSALQDKGFELVLAAGRARGHLEQRGDDRTESTADVLLNSRSVGVGGKSLLVRDVRSVLRQVQPDLVIAEQAIKNTDVYSLLMRQVVKGSPRFGLWGQGRSFSTPQGIAGSLLKQWVTRRSDWFFAYTQEGADYVVRLGVPPNRVSILNNTIDTEQLRRDLDNVSDAQVDDFRQQHSLIAGKTALFLGGVDTTKGIEFLLDSAEKVAKQIPGFRLIIAGSGSSSELVQRRQEAGSPIAFLGRLEGFDKAVGLSAADVMMIPEWVGLVAVDSLVAGCPIITTHHASHSPEFSYLIDQSNSFLFAHQENAYADGLVRVMRDSALLSTVAQQAVRDSWSYSLAGMVENFSQGVEEWWTSSVPQSKL